MVKLHNFLNREIGDKEKQKEYFKSLKRFNVERKDYKKDFSSKINELALVSGLKMVLYVVCTCILCFSDRGWEHFAVPGSHVPLPSLELNSLRPIVDILCMLILFSHYNRSRYVHAMEQIMVTLTYSLGA